MSRVLLYVEDDLNDVELIALALAKANSSLRMLTVPDGAAAIAYLSGMGKYADRGRFPMPSLILLDLTLRGLNGFEVLRWMQNEPSGAMPPVIIFSYSKQDCDVRRASELGANSFISKPISPESAVVLVQTMEEFLTDPDARKRSVAGQGAAPLETAMTSPMNPS